MMSVYNIWFDLRKDFTKFKVKPKRFRTCCSVNSNYINFMIDFIY